MTTNLSDLLVGAALGTLAVVAALRAPQPVGAVRQAGAWLRRLDARAPALLLLRFFALRAECLHVFESTGRMVAAAS